MACKSRARSAIRVPLSLCARMQGRTAETKKDVRGRTLMFLRPAVCKTRAAFTADASARSLVVDETATATTTTGRGQRNVSVPYRNALPPPRTQAQAGPAGSTNTKGRADDAPTDPWRRR